MVYVERANKVREVKESEVQRYLDLGYNVTDGKGNILVECIPTDVGTLRKKYIEYKQEIEVLKKENKDFAAQLVALKKKLTNAKNAKSKEQTEQ